MKSEKAREIIDFGMMATGDGYVGETIAVEAVETAEFELGKKYETERHILREECNRLKVALSESEKRCEIAQKVIADKNAKRGEGAAEREGMSLNDYQTRAMETCLPESRNPMYMLFGLSEEVGELCGKFAKAIRKGEIVITDNGIEYTDKCDKEAFIEAVQKEGGDVEWMLNGFFSVMGWTAESIAKGNLDKLAARKQSNTIVSHTDH